MLQRSPGIAAGDRGGHPRGARGRGASTEPRHRGRGSDAGLAYLRTKRARFNGAPASRPGIALAGGYDNESALASTEPRHRGRGSIPRSGPRTCAYALQRSPGIAAGDRRRPPARQLGSDGFNGAPASRPGIATGGGRDRAPSSCFNGAPASRPGIDETGQSLKQSASASTEPRHRGRGSARRRATRPRLRRASTEPRHRGRGSSQQGFEYDGVQLLQRSPGIAAGDRSGPRSFSSCSGCFNGAPASRPGIGGRSVAPVRVLRASTEPRHRGRGSGSSRTRPTPGQGGFNGAPASRPGIGAPHLLSARPSRRFNGAPASRPGIGGADERKVVLVRASTEPRHRGRGSWKAQDGLPGPDVLQRSPGIAAGDRRPRSWRRRSDSGFNGAPASRPGIARLVHHAHRRERASTEPRHRGRGSELLDTFEAVAGALQRSPGIAAGDRRSRLSPRRRGTCFNGAPASRPGIVQPGGFGRGAHAASTEPRHRGRGSDARTWDRERWPMLQRSPGIAAGDRISASVIPGGPITLQRSPGIAAGDRTTRTSRSLRVTRFNGAPASRPGIVRRDRVDALPLVASTEPRHRGRGSRVHRRPRPRAAHASTEPRHRGRGSTCGNDAVSRV